MTHSFRERPHMQTTQQIVLVTKIEGVYRFEMNAPAGEVIISLANVLAKVMYDEDEQTQQEMMAFFNDTLNASLNEYKQEMVIQ